MTATFYETYDKVVYLTENLEDKDLGGMVMKLMEEVGELATAVNIHLGHIKHKKMDEPIAGEGADVIQCVLSILVKVYGPTALHEFEKYFASKTDKWEAVTLINRPDRISYTQSKEAA